MKLTIEPHRMPRYPQVIARLCMMTAPLPGAAATATTAGADSGSGDATSRRLASEHPPACPTVCGAVDTLGVWAGSERELSDARQHSGGTPGLLGAGSRDEAAAPDRCGVNLRPLGVWRAAGLHARRFRQCRLDSLLILLTPTRRVERDHALATLVARDGVSLAVWAAIWLMMATVGAPASVLAALEVSPVLWPLVPLAFAATLVASSAVGQRAEVWYRWPGRRGALAVGNILADQDGHGHAGALIGDLARFADSTGRTLVLRVDATNTRALRLYRRHGFGPIDAQPSSRMRMVRQPTTTASAPSLASAPSWLAPIPISRPAVAVGTAAGVGLTATYWGTPAASLMLPIGLIASVSADCDLRWLRIPNRLLAAGAVMNVALVVLIGLLYDVSMLGPAFAGAALVGGPLFVQHVATGGRSPGLGDVKLAGVLGVVAGAVHPAAAILGLLISMLLGAAFGLGWRWGARRGPVFPLGPSLVAGMALVLAAWPLLEGPTTW